MGRAVSTESMRQTRERDGYILDLGEGASSCLGLCEGTSKHAFDGRADKRRLAENDKLEAVGGDERNVFAQWAWCVEVAVSGRGHVCWDDW